MNSSASLDSRSASLSFLLLGLGLAILLLDQLTKGLVDAYLPVIEYQHYFYPYGGIGVFKNFAGVEFSINHMTNEGAAWGLLSHYQLPLIILRLGLIAGLITYLLIYNRENSWRFPLILIIAGAVGNVVDYFVYGHVVDMFHFVFWGYDFPVFNLADSAISVGVFLLFILSMIRSPSCR
jgi:signal peptidase II